jgi:general secretion pathway protein G
MLNRLNRQHRGSNASGTKGFTLVEILIVVVILGILAAIVVPQFTSAAAESRDSSIKMNLYRIRQQLEIYREHHDGNYPSLADIETQLTGSTDVHGAPVALGLPGSFGPYLREMPYNANTNGKAVDNAAVGGSDWFYDENTGSFHANDSVETRLY